MKELSKKQILGSDGETLVWVYDGDVEYVTSGESLNYKYYYNKDRKRNKTRPYNQYSAMTNRCITNGAYQFIQPTYVGASISEDFDTFDKWCNWADKQSGYMRTTENGRIWQLDKDLLITKNKVYSPNTVCFLPDWLNSILSAYENMDSSGKRKLFGRVYNDVFDELDDIVLEKFFEMSSFNYTLSKEDRLTLKEKEVVDKRAKDIACLHSTFQGVKMWDDDSNILSGLSFTDGNYKVTVNYKRRLHCSKKFTKVLDAVLHKIHVKCEILNLIRSEFGDSEFWFSENFHKIHFDKLCELSDLEYRIKKGEVKLKQWVQVEV